MKKNFYIAEMYNGTKNNIISLGVNKKILDQYKILNKYMDLELDWYYFKDKKLSEKIKMRMPYFPVSVNWKYNDKYKFSEYIYIRKIFVVERKFLIFLKNIKDNNKRVKILYEIPTYPYDKEFTKFKGIPLLLKDKYNRKKLKKYVDKIVTLTDDKEIWGIPTIKIVNGIEVDSIKKKKVSNDTDAINLIEVSSLANWHGYDRLIKGIGEYYKNKGKRNIIFHVVGDGEEISKYKDIVKEYNIEDHVIFYGNKVGQELDDIYDKCEIGVEVLGMYRKGLNLSSSLKSREYLAKGLPIITGCDIDILKDIDFKYNLQFFNDDTVLDVDKIIDFYDKIYNAEESKQQIIDNIRNFAYKTCDMSITMKPVVDYINGDDDV